MSTEIRVLFLPSGCRMEIKSPAHRKVSDLIQRRLIWSFQDLHTALQAALGVFWVWIGRASPSDAMGHVDLSLLTPRSFSSPIKEEK